MTYVRLKSVPTEILRPAKENAGPQDDVAGSGADQTDEVATVSPAPIIVYKIIT
jgi:hypothetical protein